MTYNFNKVTCTNLGKFRKDTNIYIPEEYLKAEKEFMVFYLSLVYIIGIVMGLIIGIVTEHFFL